MENRLETRMTITRPTVAVEEVAVGVVVEAAGVEEVVVVEAAVVVVDVEVVMDGAVDEAVDTKTKRTSVILNSSYRYDF